MSRFAGMVKNSMDGTRTAPPSSIITPITISATMSKAPPRVRGRDHLPTSALVRSVLSAQPITIITTAIPTPADADRPSTSRTGEASTPRPPR